MIDSHTKDIGVRPAPHPDQHDRAGAGASRANFEIMSEEAREQLRQAIPLGRYAEPEDLSAAVRFLASEGARHITGATLDVNGGYV